MLFEPDALMCGWRCSCRAELNVGLALRAAECQLGRWLGPRFLNQQREGNQNHRGIAHGLACSLNVRTTV